MLRIAGRRYDRKGSKQLAVAATAVASPVLLARPAATSAIRKASAAAAAATSSSSVSVDAAEEVRERPRIRHPRSDLAVHSQPLFASSRSANARRTLTRLPTPLPPDAVDQKLMDALTAASSSLPAGAAGESADGTSEHQKEALRSLFLHSAFFPNSRATEDMAVLRTSLDAGLVWRAAKVFDEVRNAERARRESLQKLSVAMPSDSKFEVDSWSDSASSFMQGQRLDKTLYDDMLSAYLLKAAVSEELGAKQEFWTRAKELFSDMGKVAADSEPKSSEEMRLDALAPKQPSADADTAAVMLKGLAR